MSLVTKSRQSINELPGVPTTAISLDSEPRSPVTYISFGLIFFGALVSTWNVITSLYFQISVILPSLPPGMSFQIFNYLILDAFLIVGTILMFGGAAIIYLEKLWPYGGVIALFGAFMTIMPLSIFLGALGAFINLCNRPEPKRT